SRALSGLGAGAGLAASQYIKSLTSGTTADVAEAAGLGLAAAGGIFAALPADTYADLADADEWIDALFGTPLERTPLAPTPGAQAKPDARPYPYLAPFFPHFIPP